MKTTIKINLSGQIFTLDADAYQALKDYLDSISKRFRDMEEGSEIISDIESRIAELFLDRISGKKQVITIEDVNEVIGIMGQPEDFIEGEKETSDQAKERTGKRTRRYYRDPDNFVLGGVASGLAAYFGIEIWLMRLLWVIFFLATGGGVILILYIVLWIAVPRAQTAAEKLEMRGEKVTVENIGKTVREEYEMVSENAKNTYKKVKKSGEFKKTKSVFNEILQVFGKIILVFLKIFLAIVGIAFIIGGLSVLAGLSIGLFFRHILFPVDVFGSSFHSFSELSGIFIDPANLTFISIALFFVIVIPLIALIYTGIKILFRFKAKDRMIGLTAFVLWILSLVSLISIAAFEGWHFNDYGQYTSTNDLSPFPSDTLFVTMENDTVTEGFKDHWYFNYNDSWYVQPDKKTIYGKIELNIEPSDFELFEISVQKNSQGRNRVEAAVNAENLEYNWRQEGNELILNPYFSLPMPNRWRLPGTSVTLNIPAGKHVRLDRNTRYFLNDVESAGNEQDHKFAGEVWIMTEEGLMTID